MHRVTPRWDASWKAFRNGCQQVLHDPRKDDERWSHSSFSRKPTACYPPDYWALSECWSWKNAPDGKHQRQRHPSSMPCRNLSICSRVQWRRQKKRCTYLKCTNPFCHSWLTIWIRFTLFVSTYLLSWINPFTSKKTSAYESFTNQPKKPLITNLTINLKKLCMNRKIFIRKVCMSSWSTTIVIDYETARCSSRTMTRSSLSAHSCHLFCASERS